MNHLPDSPQHFPAALGASALAIGRSPRGRRRALVAAMLTAAGFALSPETAAAQGGGTLRVAMTASDIPTTTGVPNNGFEGMRFLGCPIFEGPTWTSRA